MAKNHVLRDPVTGKEKLGDNIELASNGDVALSLYEFDGAAVYSLVQSIGERTFRFTHSDSGDVTAQKTFNLHPRFRARQMELDLNVFSTASEGNFSIVITDETDSENPIVLLDEQIQKQDGALPEQFSRDFETLDTTTALKVVVTASQESGSPTSDLSDLVIRVKKQEKLIREKYRVKQYPTETKFLSSDMSDNGIELSDLTFDNLVVGAEYRVILHINAGPTNTNSRAGVTIHHNGEVIGHNFIYAGSSATVEGQPFVKEFTATASSITFQSSIFGLGTISGNSTPEETFVQLKRIDLPIEKFLTQEIKSPAEIFTQTEDLQMTWQGFAGLGSVRTAVPYFTNERELTGDSISWTSDTSNGLEVTIEEDDFYIVKLSTNANVGGNSIAAIGKNLSSFTSFDPASELILDTAYGASGNADREGVTAIYAGPLKKGDKLYPLLASAPTQIPSHVFFSIAKQGRAKVASVSKNSKIKLPSSFIHMTGCSGYGSGDDALKLKMINVDEFRGNHLSLDNSNATKITVKKDGEVSVALSLVRTESTGLTFWVNIAGKKYGAGLIASASGTNQIAQIGTPNIKVKAGDVIFIESSVAGRAPTASTESNLFSVFFRETEVAVAVSNIEPQWEDDGCEIVFSKGTGYASSLIRARRFTNIEIKKGTSDEFEIIDNATEGTYLKIKKDGLWSAIYTESFNPGGSYFGAVVNSIKDGLGSTDINEIAANSEENLMSIEYVATSTAIHTVVGEKFLRAGDTVHFQTYQSMAIWATEVSKVVLVRRPLPSIVGANLSKIVRVPKYNAESLEVQSSLTIEGTLGDPVKGAGFTNSIGRSRSGSKARIVGGYEHTTGGSGGDGTYLISLPDGMRFDTSKTIFDTNAYGAGGDGGNAFWSSKAAIGTATVSTGSAQALGAIIPYDATRFRIGLNYINTSSAGGPGMWGVSWFSFTESVLKVSFDFNAYIEGWETYDMDTLLEFNDAARVGGIEISLSGDTPDGFIPAMGESIGNAGSGADFEGDIYRTLFNKCWDIADTDADSIYVISSAKGASASADWAAGKTITIDHTKNGGMFFRSITSGRDAGSYQEDAFQGHFHTSSGYTNSTGGGVVPYAGTGGSTGIDNFAETPTTDGVNGTPRTADETRSKNVAYYVYIRYSAREAVYKLATPKKALISEEYAAGVSGQNTSSSYTARRLNTLEETSPFILNPDDFTGAGGTNTSIQLPAGKYFLKAKGYVSRTTTTGVIISKMRLYNVTAGAAIKAGMIGQDANPTGGQNESVTLFLDAIFELTEDSVLQIQQIANTAGESMSLPYNTGDNEVYLTAEIEKIY